MNIVAITILVVVILALVIFSAKCSPDLTRHFSIRVSGFIVGGYVAIISLLAVGSLFLPAKALNKGDSVDSSKVFGCNAAELCSNIKKGNFSPMGGFSTVKAYSFVAQSRSLTIKQQNYQVLVGKKGIDAPDNGNGKIDVYAYQPKHRVVTLQGENIVFKIPEPVVSYNGSILSLNEGPKSLSNFYQFCDGYTVSQFFREKYMVMSAYGYTTIIVLIPKDMSFSGDWRSISDLTLK